MQELHLSYTLSQKEQSLPIKTNDQDDNVDETSILNDYDKDNVLFWLRHLISFENEKMNHLSSAAQSLRQCCIERLLQPMQICEPKTCDEMELIKNHFGCIIEKKTNEGESADVNNNDNKKNKDDKDHWCVKIELKKFTIKQLHVSFCNEFNSICVVAKRVDADGLHVELHRIPIPQLVDSETIKVNFTEDRILVINGEYYKVNAGSKRNSKSGFDEEFELLSNSSSDTSSTNESMSIVKQQQGTIWCSEDCTPIEEYFGNARELFYPKEDWTVIAPEFRGLELELKKYLFLYQESQTNQSENSKTKNKTQKPNSFLGQISFRIVKTVENLFHDVKEWVWPSNTDPEQNADIKDKTKGDNKKSVCLEVYINLEDFSAAEIQIEQSNVTQLKISAGNVKSNNIEEGIVEKKFRRKLNFPSVVDLSSIKAVLLKNGVLKLRLPIKANKLNKNN